MDPPTRPRLTARGRQHPSFALAASDLASDAKRITAAASFPPMLQACGSSTTERASRRDVGILLSRLATRAGIVGRLPNCTIIILRERIATLSKTAI